MSFLRKRRADRRTSIPPARKPSVLFVDDDASVRTMFVRLASSSFDVTLASSGSEALALAQRESFSVVVVDLHMPVMSGQDFVERFAVLRPEVSCVITTGLAQLDLCLHPGAELSTVGVLLKPWDSQELLAVLDRAVERTRIRCAPPSIEPRSTGHALLLEDDDDDAFVTQQTLSAAGWRCDHVMRLEDAQAAALSRPYDALLVDLTVPDGRGVDAVVRLHRCLPNTPIVVLSGRDDDVIACQAIRAGAQDYLVKGVRAEALARSLRLSRERAQERRRLRDLAHFDQLTGLANRSTLESRLRRAIATSRLSKQPMAVIYLDLDEFKSVNDTWGHDVGDALLREVANRLCEGTRDTDTPARLGGDEFVVLLTELEDRRDAELVATRLLASIRRPYLLAGGQLRITASVGVAVVNPEEDASLEELIRQADARMYAAKRSGRNSVVSRRPDHNSG